MSEQAMRQRVVALLKSHHGVSVENPANPGTPDVNFVEGWVELKWLRDWPRREDTVVEVDHFTPQQRVWLHRRYRAGGNVWLLLQCRREWLLFTGDVAAEHVGRATRRELIAQAAHVWNVLDEEALRCVLTRQRRS